MALPLLWLGAAVVGAMAAKEYSDKVKSSEYERWLSDEPMSHDHDEVVGKYPTELFHQGVSVEPHIGSLVCCGIGGVLEHTGIWIGDNTIVELDGNGLVKGLSPTRFLHNRTGNQIFVACDSHATPIADVRTAEMAASLVFQYREYDLVNNNCHRFVWHCISGKDEKLTTFSELNKKLALQYNRKIYWDLCQIA